jgi:hypothetical protein
MGAVPIPKTTVQAYLAAERVAEFRSEYHDGEVFPMEGAWSHALVAANAAGCLVESLRASPCRVAFRRTFG